MSTLTSRYVDFEVYEEYFAVTAKESDIAQVFFDIYANKIDRFIKTDLLKEAETRIEGGQVLLILNQDFEKEFIPIIIGMVKGLEEMFYMNVEATNEQK